jgi:hypothetical protein
LCLKKSLNTIAGSEAGTEIPEKFDATGIFLASAGSMEPPFLTGYYSVRCGNISADSGIDNDSHSHVINAIHNNSYTHIHNYVGSHSHSHSHTSP